MSICHLITILALDLLIQTSHPFKPPKHNIISYYKTVNNVFLTNPFNHTTGYGIYVAGETTTVDIPSNVANVYDIVNWKVVNVDKDRLMFVHNNKPQIMINQKSFRRMEYSGELSESIIAFGDNVTLHVPTIFNPNLTEPPYKWNYIELLYFDAQSEKVSVIQSLPWLKGDDWRFIKEWKMMDYIHFDDKLYLLIKRSIWNENYQSFTQEIAIIRLYLERGSQLILSAIDIHFTRPEFQNSRIIEAIFKLRRMHFPVNHYNPGSFRVRRPHSVSMNPNNKYDLFITFDTPNKGRMAIDIQISNTHNEDIFDIVEGMCASGVRTSQINLLQYHLRSESGKCKKSIYPPCSLAKNFIPSFDATERAQVPIDNGDCYESIHGNESFTVKHQSITFGHPFSQWFFFRIQNSVSISFLPCSCFTGSYLHFCWTETETIEAMKPKWERFNIDVEQRVFVNQRPLGGFFIAKKSNEIIFFDFNLICAQLNNCIDCIMYGLYFNCVWSDVSSTHPNCMLDDQAKHKTALTVNHCIKIIHFSPSVFKLSVQQTLSIQLNTPLRIENSEESLFIHAGPDNFCTNITMRQLYIQCSLSPLKSGNFNIEMSLMDDKIADVTMISAVSTKMVQIIAPERASAMNTAAPDYFFKLKLHFEGNNASSIIFIPLKNCILFIFLSLFISICDF